MSKSCQTTNQASTRVDPDCACGVCGSDIPRVLFKGAHKLPLICGHEFSGHIEELGSGMEGWQHGELVTVPPLIPCGTCEQCLRGVPSRCQDYDYFGSRRDGAYTEYALVPRANLIRVPSGVSPETAAFTDPAAIALHALMKTGLGAGQTLGGGRLRRYRFIGYPVGQVDGGLTNCRNRHPEGSH